MKITIPSSGIVLLIGATNNFFISYNLIKLREETILPSEVISSDDYRLVVGDTNFIEWTGRPKDEADSLYDQYYTISKEAFHMMDNVIEARCRLNKLTFIDATHLFSDDRKKYIALARKHHVPIVAVVLDIPQETLLERDEQREQPRGKKKVKQQYQNLKREKRSIKKEGFKSIYSINAEE